MDVFTKEALENKQCPIVHGVFGGKTGVRDTVMPGSTDEVMGVVDACQGRFTEAELTQWMEQESIVLFTGSKFYQAPPFCGAIIVPPTMATTLSKTPETNQPLTMLGSDGLGAFVTDKELPSCLNGWKPHLRDANANNIGLVLRWEAGLAGMEALAPVPEDERTAAVGDWAGKVTSMVEEELLLDPWCVERSIVSIRVAKGGGEDEGWLNVEELRMLYRWMSLDVSGAVEEGEVTVEEREALSTPAYIGQPVDVSETHGIVRIALGVESLISYLEDRERTLAEDRLTVTKLAVIAKHFDKLKESGL